MRTKVVKELPPGKGNPRNSEGSFLKLEDGTILFAYSKYIGDNHRDDAYAAVACLYSHDNGESFGNEKILFSPEEHKAKNLMSQTLLRLPDKSIALFYMVRYGFHDLRLHIRKSFDEGVTFKEATCCIPYPGYYVTNNDRVVVLSNNRLIIPAAYHRCLHSDYDDWTSFDGKGMTRFFISDDYGETFRESRGYGVLNSGTSKTGLQEPGVIEIEDGHLLCYCRTDQGCQYLSHSYDFGESWTSFNQSLFFAPTSPMSMKRIDSKTIISVYNPLPISPIVNEGGSWGRTPLIGALSNDNGSSFTKFFMIED
ncbi:MAG: exo-alpha-sialidase, partial [Clostridia bacterium]|nr:exo-alpha-sialidase [Clostridia bacterium]